MSDLFLDHVHTLSFEKIAMPVKLSDDPSAWQREVASEIYKQLPYLGDYSANVILDRVDAQRGYAFGSVEVGNKTDAPKDARGELPKVKIPVIIKERMMAPLDVFMDGKGVYPLSEGRLREHLFRTDAFELSERKPQENRMREDFNPPGQEKGASVKTAGFFSTLRQNPKKDELNKAFALYKKKTGKDPSSMSWDEINHYVDRVRGKTKTANQAEALRKQMVRMQKAQAAASPTEYGAKLADLEGPKPSLIEAIAPTVPESEADELVDSICRDEALATATVANPAFSNLVTKLASAPRIGIQKTAAALVGSIRPTVVQFEKLASGDFKVKWANVNAFAPQEGVVPPAQANTMAGTDMSQVPDGGTVTVGTEKAKKTQLKEETYVQVTDAGVYKVRSQDTGEELVGHCMAVVDFDMHPLEMFVFVSPTAYACQDMVAGVPQSDATAAPPTEQPVPLEQAQGDGCLFYDIAGKYHCLLPMTVQNTSQGPDGSMQVHAQSVFGEPLTLWSAPGLQAIQELGDGEYAVPDFVQWCPLQNPIFLAKTPEDTNTQQQAQEAPGAVDVGSTGAGEFSMDGPPLAKVAKDKKQFLKTAEAEFLLVSMGLTPYEARDVMKTARVSGHCKVAGLITITPLADLHRTMVKKAAKTLEDFDYSFWRRNLVKEAAVLDDADTADKVLAMNFINPENISTFAGYLPELDTAVSKLAEMLMATRMGMKNVDEGALERSMKNMENVIGGLKMLQQREQV